MFMQNMEVMKSFRRDCWHWYNSAFQKNFEDLAAKLYLQWRTVEACTKETSGSANQMEEMDQTYTEEGFLCYRETKFELETKRTI
jgi:hypothetical protein